MDFKLSTGYEGRVVVEVKLSSNPRLIHGFEMQLPLYARSEATRHSVYLILRISESENSIKSVEEMIAKAKSERKKVADLYVIDARPRKPASKA